MTPKLYKAADVCDLAKVQPYVLRSWEKEFPGIGVQKSADSTRLYRQSDVDQVLLIKQLVFGEGLTVSGARRRLEETAGAPSRAQESADAEEAFDVFGADARTKIAAVREGLKAIHVLLSQRPGVFTLQPPPSGRTVGKASGKTPSAKKAAAATLRVATRGKAASASNRKAQSTMKPAAAKGRRANA